MKKLFAVSSFLGGFLMVSPGHAADLKQSKFTQVVNDVEVISQADNSQKAAVVNAIFNMPDLVRTGDASRAELVAGDDTITRVGANTIFSFDPADRTIDLQQGSLLFHSPKGKGGGTIRTSSATASVLGTTIIVTTTHSGGFKVIDLEGHVAIKFLTGLRQDLNPGQMTFVLPGGHPAPIINIRLDTLTKESHLVQGFAAPLPSMPLIQQQVETQVKQIQSGQAQDTGLLVGDEATSTSVQVVKLDPNTQSIPVQTNDVSSTTVAVNSSTPDPAFINYISNSGNAFATFNGGSNTLPNLIINSPFIDLSPYASQVSSFGFLAPDTLTINGSVTFNGLPANTSSFLGLIAGNQLLIAPGSNVEADVGHFFLNAQDGMTFNGVNILNNNPAGGSIVIGSLNVSTLLGLTGSAALAANAAFGPDGLPGPPPPLSLTTTINGGSIQATSVLAVSAQNDVSITGSSLVASNVVLIDSLNGNITLTNPTLVETGALVLDAVTGSITVNGGGHGGGGGGGGGGNGNFQVGNVTLNAGNTITLDGGNQSPSAGPSQTNFNFAMMAANLITVQNLDMGGFATVNMTANTINLMNVDFASGSTVTLTTHFGQLSPLPANMGNASRPGYVNFISNVTYGGTGQFAQNHIVSSGPGIILVGNPAL